MKRPRPITKQGQKFAGIMQQVSQQQRDDQQKPQQQQQHQLMLAFMQYFSMYYIRDFGSSK